jgi:undecaprenyl-diphosphatase
MAGELELRHAVALGVLQGPAELLPISSSGHIALVPKLLGWPYADLDPDWVETVFEQVVRLVAEGDEAYLVQRIAEVARESVGEPVETSRDRSHV